MGGDASTNVNVAGRYNPATDTWALVTTSGAPPGRINHTAVWTGTEMIVWGGVVFAGGIFGLYSDGGRYNPATDTWSPMVLEARYGHSAVWTGDEMIVWGGLSFINVCNQSVKNDGAAYNPATDSWRPLNTVGAPSPPHSHNAVWTGSTMLVWGARDVPRGRGCLPDSRETHG